MKSLRVRLLLMLLALVTLVVGGLSWYIYEQMNLLLVEKELATEKLLQSTCQKRCDEYKKHFENQMVLLAERLGRQAYVMVELSNSMMYRRSHAVGTLTSFLGNQNLAGYLNLVSNSISNGDPRMYFQLYTKRTVTVENRVLDGDEYFHVWTSRASSRSKNLPEDCFAFDSNLSSSLQLYMPEVREEVLKCGKRFSMVSLKLPIAYDTLFAGQMQMGRTQMGPMPPRRQGSRQTPPPEPRGPVPPRPANSIVIQVAKETDARDRTLNLYREEMQRELSALHKETASIRNDTVNRLVLLSLGTICLCALAITWLSRASLAPLVNVADAVSDLTPQDLRLKLHGKELDPKKLPEELAPIVQRLQESLESLEAAFAREKRATADISHELRTPLASLMTTAQVALRKPRSPEEYKATLQQCVETGSHMSTLVERLLILSRLDAGVDPLRRDSVEIVDLAGQCVDMIRPLADQRQISIELDVDESASQLESQTTDAAKMREVLVNLLDNAVHYNRDHGEVTLRIAAAPKSVILEVIDTGVGMSEEIRTHLFERFYRADPSRQSTSVNAGLGLAIVKGYVDLFGGTISVTSEVGKGSTFRITLPREKNRIPVAV